MAYQVTDAAGRLIEVEDGEPVPRGCSLRVPAFLMDGEQRAVAAATWRDQDDEGDDDSDDDLTDEEAAQQRCADAYEAMKERLGTPKAQRQPLPQDPSWLKPQPKGKPKKRKRFEIGGTASSADPTDAAREAYDERSRRMADGWKYKRQKPHNAGPWGAVAMDRAPGQPAWMRADGTTPSVGPSGRSPYSRANMSDGEQAYRRMCDSLSNRWRTHRRPAVSGGGA